GVDPVLAGKHDGPTAGDDGSGGKSVADLVDQGATNVDVAAGTVEQERDDAVHDHVGRSHGHHHASVDLLGMLDAAEGLVENEERYDDQGPGVGERGEDSGAVVAVGLGRAGRAGL